MTYETIDWEAEAKRVKAAFDAQGTCEFRHRKYGQTEHMEFRRVDGVDSDVNLVRTSSGLWAYASYSADNRWYYVKDSATSAGSAIDVFPDGSSLVDSDNGPYALLLARALWLLDLLTPALETELQVSLSAHQKLEWKMDYEARLRGDL